MYVQWRPETDKKEGEKASGLTSSPRQVQQYLAGEWVGCASRAVGVGRARRIRLHARRAV